MLPMRYAKSCFSKFAPRESFGLSGFFNSQGLLTEGFFWIPSLGGPTTIAARQSGAGISWLFPFVVI
jgi:hypothetical protein